MGGVIDFQAVFEQSLEAKILLGEDGRVLTATTGFLHALDTKLSAISGLPITSIPPYRGREDVCRKLTETIELVRTNRVSLGVSFASVGDGWPANWSRGTVRPVTDAEGELAGFVCALEHGAEVGEESASERRFRKLVERAQDCLALRDVYGRVTYVTPSVRRISGYTPEEFAAQTPLAELHPDDVPAFVESIGRLREEPGGTFQASLRVRHANGSWRNLDLTVANLLADPDVAAIVTTFHDVTPYVELERQHRESVERLRVALSAARAMSWDVDLDTGRVVHSSDRNEFFGLPPPKDGEQVSVVHVEDRERMDEAIRRCREDGAPVNLEFRGPDRDGKSTWFAAHGQLIPSEHGRPTRLVGVTWDVTERHRLAEERSLIDQRMQESQKLESLGVLAGGVAHDFNNILMAILGNVSLAQLACESNELALGHLSQVEDASRRAADLCRQMLAYAGKGRFVLAQTDMNALVKEITYLLQVSISKKATLRFSLDESLPRVVVDATQMRQVLMNLVINASDAIGERNGTITICTGVVSADRHYLDKTFMAPDIPAGDYVFLEVNDTGAGMSAETQARMFEPFYTTKFAGRGLGLAAVLGIIRGHKGALKVYSELGKGTSFKLLIPTQDDATVESRRPSRGPALAAHGTILVIDDEENVRNVTCRMVQFLGFQVRAARDGQEALALYKEHEKDIVGVLVDLTMPRLDGEETFRELRRLNPEIRVLLMSGYNEQDAIGRFVGKGLAGFLQKPFTLHELEKKLATVIA